MLSEAMRTVLEGIGADVPTALSRLNNNEKLFAKLLVIFCSSNADAPAQYRAHIAANEAELLLRLVHDLKSSSGNLGLTGLYEMALAFEMTVKTTNTLDKVAGEALADKLEEIVLLLGSVD